LVDDKEAFERLKVVHLQFENVEVLRIPNALHIIEGKPAKTATLLLGDNPALARKAIDWVTTGQM